MVAKSEISKLLGSALSDVVEAKGKIAAAFGEEGSAWAGRALLIEQLFSQFDEIERKIKDVDLDVQA